MAEGFLSLDFKSCQLSPDYLLANRLGGAATAITLSVY